MRDINWIKFRESPKYHLTAHGCIAYFDSDGTRHPVAPRECIKETGILAYDTSARIISYVPDPGRQIALWADVTLPQSHMRYGCEQRIVFDGERYTFVIGNRLSSTPVHRKAFEAFTWLTTADRDLLIAHILA